MKLKFVLAACVLAGIPLVLPSASAECDWDELIHVYLPSGYGSMIINENSFLPGGPPVVLDTCTDPYRGYLVGDGDFEAGIFGGRFPVHQECLNVYYRGGGPVHPTYAHHYSYEGAAYTAFQYAAWSTLGIAAFAGTDGEEIAGTCIGDGIIDDINPVDCGSGPIGTGFGEATAVIIPNPPLLDPFTGTVLVEADCTKPAEGMAWVVLFTGIVSHGFNPFVSIPVSGAIFQTA